MRGGIHLPVKGYGQPKLFSRSPEITPEPGRKSFDIQPAKNPVESSYFIGT
jgi:hypothetical protein